jgi:regulator of replication initiation timing
MDNLFLLVAVLFALSALGALLLRSRPTPTAPPRPSPPVTEASSQAPVTVGPAKHQAAEPGPVPATTTDDAGPTRQPVLATSNSLAGPESAQQTRDRATGERDEPTATTVQTDTVQADGDGTSTRRPATADELNAIRTRIGQLLDQVATLRQQATDLATTQTELATNHEQVEKRLPDHQSLARSRTGGQKPKFGPRQVELARQMHDELDKNGKRRYTVQQIADAFSVTPATIYRHLRKITSKT